MLKGLLGDLAKRSSWNPGTRPKVSLWPTALIGIVVIKAVLSLGVKPGSFLLSYSGISYFLLLMLATGFAVRNAIQKTLGRRPFWVLLAIGYGLWTLSQGTILYYELVLHIEVPNRSIADPALFLHIVPLIAAAITLQDQNAADRKLYRVILNSLLLLFFWAFLYGYTVFPYQYFPGTTSYALPFDILYLLENLALLLVVGVLALRVPSPWKPIYLHLLGASTVYALSSTVANLAIDSGGYVNGKLYGLGLTVSVCWFVWIPLRARQAGAAATDIPPDGVQSPLSSAWAMLVAVMVPIPMIWELLQRNVSGGVPIIRISVAVVAILCLTSAAYMKEYLARREMDFHFGLANESLRLAMEASASVGWDLEVKSGRNVWFGDLQNTFGIAADTYVTTGVDFTNRIHPEDRAKVSEAIATARESKRVYTSEFRVLHSDGTIRWLEARGKFYYARNGSPERMLGVALDITKRKLAEEALSGMTRRVIEAEERERDRVAKDLHENIGQRLALLAIAIQQIKKDESYQAPGFLDPMEAVWRKTLEILADVKASAHELYSPRLEYLGIAGVMKTFCEEFADRKKVEIDFSSHGFVHPVLPDVSICLFRVLQEALHNGVMHSGVRKFSVQIWAEADEVHLKVSDAGVGFDFDAARDSRGLGLVRIEQRVKLVEGTTFIDSHPEKGTTVQVNVPIHSGSTA